MAETLPEPLSAIDSGIHRGSSARAAVLATAATFFAYAATLAQQVLFARALGISPATDALAAALAWAVAASGPIGVTLGTVLIPRYVLARASGDFKHARMLFQTISAVGGTLGITLALGSYIASAPLSAAIGPGLDQESSLRLQGLIRLTAPLQLLWVVVWLLVSRANSRERYVLAAASFAIAPVPVIILLVSVPGISVEQVAFAYLLGASAQAALLGLADRNDVGDLVPRLHRAVARSLVGALVLVGAGYGLMSLVGLVIRGVASLEGPGAVATADYASRLEVAGEQVLLSGVLAVVFTEWSRAAVAGASDGSALQTSFGVGAARLVGIAVAAIFAVPLLAVPLVGTLLEGGRFMEADTAGVSSFLAWMGPGIAGRVLVLLAIRGLLVTSRYRMLAVVGLVAVIAAASAGLAARVLLGLDGVAAAYSVAWVAAGLFAIGALGVSFVSLTREGLRSALAAAGAYVVTVVGFRVVPDVPFVRLLVGAVLFASVAWAIGHVIGVAAVRDIERRLDRRRVAA